MAIAHRAIQTTSCCAVASSNFSPIPRATAASTEGLHVESVRDGKKQQIVKTMDKSTNFYVQPTSERRLYVHTKLPKSWLLFDQAFVENWHTLPCEISIGFPKTLRVFQKSVCTAKRIKAKLQQCVGIQSFKLLQNSAKPLPIPRRSWAHQKQALLIIVFKDFLNVPDPPVSTPRPNVNSILYGIELAWGMNPCC